MNFGGTHSVYNTFTGPFSVSLLSTFLGSLCLKNYSAISDALLCLFGVGEIAKFLNSFFTVPLLYREELISLQKGYFPPNRLGHKLP